MVSQSSTRRPRIAIVAQFPFGAFERFEGRGAGQQATWLPQLAMAWANQQEFEIHWHILAHKEQTSRSIQRWGQWFHLIPTSSITVGMLTRRIPQRLAYRRMFDMYPPDLVNVWGTENLYGACLDDYKGPSILSMQGVVGAIHRTGDLKGWRWNFIRHWELKSLRQATVISCESEWGIAKIHELVPGLITRKIEYGVSHGYYETTWNPDPHVPEVLYAGTLCRYKGTDILIKMLERHRNRDWKMVIAGDGYLRNSLQRLEDPKIELLGTVTSTELCKRMATSWVLVHPSRADTSPNVVKEARVIGLPVIGSSHGGHAEYIKNGVDGLRIESEDPDEWFAAINTLCSDFQKCRSMGAVNHAHYRAALRPSLTAQAFLDLYRKLLTSNQYSSCGLTS
jgi:glycosyltransferase involved in cell wall biosynthesis